MKEDLYQQTVQYLTQGKIPEKINNNKEEKKWKGWCTKYQVVEGVFYRKAKWPKLTKVVKYEETAPIIYLYHNDLLAGHLGTTKTLHKLKAQYFWS